ncbi:MAG: sporulation initiation factor Spo0A C-terminal domain-containing protein [bacterium]|nr:sporulation initiation factor Spo0A C-terminal domain-containing protein [bacterium]
MEEAVQEAIQILLVEDEMRVCDIYRQTLMNNEKMELVCATGSEKEALNYIEHEKVDVIILDLELWEGDGLSFIFQLDERAQKGKDKPLVFVVTNNSSVVTWETAKGYGADFVIPKMTKEYSPIAVLSKIEKSYPYYKRREKQGDIESRFVGTDASGENALKHIYQYIENMGLLTPKQGILFMSEAILQLMQWRGPGILHLSNDVYPMIAEKYHVAATSVEKDIRAVIRRGWTKIDEEKLEKYYPYEIEDEKSRPTNTELIENLAKLLKG